MFRSPLAFLLASAFVIGSASLQSAAADSPPADLDPWRINVALYGWAINVSGNVTVRNQTLDTNASTLDLLQKSNSLGGFMGYFEADKGPAGLYADLVYTSLGFGADRVGYRNPIAGLRITTTASAALTYQLFIVEVGGLYELVRWPGGDGSLTAIDAVLGFRYWNNSVAASFDATANLNFSNLHIERSFGIAVARSDVVQWVDPVFGLRLRHRFTPNQEIFVRGDIGGFGLGSQFSWQAVAAYSYAWQFTGYQIAAALGFRALGVNYTSGSGVDTLAINEVLYGPIIGVSFRF
jgi:hypothetical protein